MKKHILDILQRLRYLAGMDDTSKVREALRHALAAHPKSRYRIAKESGISESMLSLFAAGKRGMTLERLELLADYLGLEIVVQPKGGATHG